MMTPCQGSFIAGMEYARELVVCKEVGRDNPVRKLSEGIGYEVYGNLFLPVRGEE